MNLNMLKKEKFDSVGWIAIDKSFEKIYKDKKVLHFVNENAGHNDNQIDCINIYDAGDYWHFVTYGLSNLYEGSKDNNDVSGHGLELTFKLKKGSYSNENNEIECICSLLRYVASFIFAGNMVNIIINSKNISFDSEKKSDMTGLLLVPDEVIQSIDTPNGKVEFKALVGIKNEEIDAINKNLITKEELYKKIASDVNDYNRKSIM